VLDVVRVTRVSVIDAEFQGERQVSTVGASLIPSLDSCTDGAEDDREVHGPRLVP
jgi:hypothetical protein